MLPIKNPSCLPQHFDFTSPPDAPFWFLTVVRCVMSARSLAEDESDERTTLLGAPTEDRHDIDEELLLSYTSSSDTLRAQATKSKPFSWRPFLVIMVLNAAQPLAFELVFPFVNQMILEIGVVDDPERVGFYSGVIESIFAFMGFLFVMPCSILSDHKKYWFMIATRSAGGVSSASWSTLKVMLGEMTDRENQGKAFAAFGVSYRIGQILGQPIGGLLSHPERNFPILSGPFWQKYPFAFPCLFSASIAWLAVIVGCFTLKETKPTQTEKRRSQSDCSNVSSEGITVKRGMCLTWGAALTPHVINVLVSLVTMVIASEMLFAVYPLFAFTPVEFGGLGLSEAAIVQKRFGTMRTYQLTMLIWPINAMFFPLLNLLARWNASKLVMDAVLVLFFTVWGIANISWPASSVMINDAAPSAESLAAINGISQMAIVLPEAVAPAFVTSMFAYSVSSGILGGNLIWIIMFGVGCVASIHCLILKEPTYDWRKEHEDEAEDLTN
ncbi:hypothetical protein EW145_g841 [Phellinidium pouzarii]|uniref:Major facilitator superfamily (MFS) profile domain-containing protein n=1 Tax=Phellinidium pouzarii TaxID=167371 RepID=A0A4S4LH02_9AGAM|nr:hypothetical protein EW145_g841 [Phellinidium pouzarii]